MIAAVFSLGVALEIGQRPGRQDGPARTRAIIRARFTGSRGGLPRRPSTPRTRPTWRSASRRTVWASGEPRRWPVAWCFAGRIPRAVHPGSGSRWRAGSIRSWATSTWARADRGFLPDPWSPQHDARSGRRGAGAFPAPGDPALLGLRLRHWEAKVCARRAARGGAFLRAVWLGDRGDYAEADYQPFLKRAPRTFLRYPGFTWALSTWRFSGCWAA